MPLIVLPNTTCDAATNMATDVSLLYSVPAHSAIFRHYSWIEPTITFGYTQQIEEVKAIVPNSIHLCRRITGGGIVDHRNDWTYALVLHSHLKMARMTANELYAKIHQCIQHALGKQSIESQLAPCPIACGQSQLSSQSTGPNQCFVQPTANDVLSPDGQKIAGAAMKRTRAGLLVQGSIDRKKITESFDFQSFSNVLTKMIADWLDLDLCPNDKNLPSQQSIQQELRRFESNEWKYKR